MGETPEVIDCNDDELLFALALPASLASAKAAVDAKVRGANVAAPESFRKSRLFIIIPFYRFLSAERLFLRVKPTLGPHN
jgi:hypothetical protein